MYWIVRTGAIRYNTTQLQFEGFNGSDFVSLGGVRDVDQDTYILTESAPGADEDTFEFYAAGQNNLAINNNSDLQEQHGNCCSWNFEYRTPGTLSLNGTLVPALNVNVVGQTILQVRSQKDVELIGGLRLRAVPAQGVVSAFDNATLTQVPTSYTASTTFTAVATIAQVEGTGLTVDVIDARWNW